MNTNYADIKNRVFKQAVEAVDTGNIYVLDDILTKHPSLINEQTHFPGAGYFENPYLIYFLANNPIRKEMLPENILDVMKLLLERLLDYPAADKQHQMDYTLGLISSGRIAKESGKQIAMMDLLLDAGATPGNGAAALAHGNIEAAKHLTKRGGTLTLTAAACFNEIDKATVLFANASDDQKLTALTAAAFYGYAQIISYLLANGVNPNGYPSSGFHTHATPLHQAVYSASLESVKLLVEAGASLNAADKAYNGTPLGWAKYMQEEEAPTDEDKVKYKTIEEYLNKI